MVQGIRNSGNFTVPPCEACHAPGMAIEAETCTLEPIRQCFRKFDSDENGFISKAELRYVLMKLTPGGEHLTVNDIDQLMHEADRNKNGRIEYDEFVAWLHRPGAGVNVSDDGSMEVFDMAGLLRPLFQVYDKNGDGTISPSEFEECHNILQSALSLHPVGVPGSPCRRDPEDMAANADSTFGKVDRDVDRRISFEEFVAWQRAAVEKSGLVNSDLVDLVPALARQLKRIFNLAESNEKGELTDNDKKVLMRITENIANFSRDLWDKREEGEAGHNTLKGKHHYTNRWSEPPVGLNVNRLKAQHLKHSPFPQWGVDKVDLMVFIVPEHQEPEAHGDQPHRRWYGRLLKRVWFKTGREEVDEPDYYAYDVENLTWNNDEDYSEAFDKASELLPPELRIFCLLKAEANFGIQMSREAVQVALDHAIVLDLLTEAQRNHCNRILDNQLLTMLRENEDMSGSEREAERLQRLREHVVLAPRNVMATLAEAGILRISSVWADVLKA
eukprot:TRINITY_DN18571_c0_g1_i1.p1 TRINITY_DN18571_c0_g1~~TRINITY_DN18571_c0_g1_i1.p1  ORF type:complete len:501 (-),score=110.24 TRINITY_DN18571_c0_g1_i1:47-1549(-)